MIQIFAYFLSLPVGAFVCATTINKWTSIFTVTKETEKLNKRYQNDEILSDEEKATLVAEGCWGLVFGTITYSMLYAVFILILFLFK